MKNREHSNLRFLHATIGILALSLAVIGLHANVARAASWSASPYNVQIWLAPDPQADTRALCDERLRKEMVSHLAARLARAWRTDFVLVPYGAALDDPQLEFADVFRLNPSFGDTDKVFIVRLIAARGGYELTVRELDCRTQTWSPFRSIAVPNPAEIATAATSAILDAYRPIARLRRVQQSEVRLEPRAGMLAIEGSPLLPAVGSGMKALICKQGTGDQGVAKQVQEVEHTVLVVESVVGDRMQATLISGLRAPLRTRGTRNVERYAISMSPVFPTTKLVLRDRNDPERALVGYDVVARPYPGKETDLVGRSDADGQVTIDRSEALIQTLYIKHGRHLVAKLPLVVGDREQVIVELADDSVRLAAEGFLKGIEDRLTDAGVVREMIRHRLQLGENLDFDELETQLKTLDGQRRNLLRVLQSRQPEFRSADARAQRRIDRMFTDSRSLIQATLDPEVLAQLRDELDGLRR